MSDANVNWVQYDGRRYMLAEGETAMEALRRGGAEVTFSCRKGSCWTCLLQAESGTPDPASQDRLPQELRDSNLFLPCIARHMDAVVAKAADLSVLFIQGLVAEKDELAPGIWRLRIEMPLEYDWKPGQYIKLRNPDGEVRSYSIASVREDDFFLELHVRHYPGGKVSDWIVNRLQPGDPVMLRGPMGECVHAETDKDRPLLIVATGTGAAPMLGIAREALRQGHAGPIHFYHGSALESSLYLRGQLAALAAEHPNFHARMAASQEGEQRRITDIAMAEHPDLYHHAVYVAGDPDAVEAVRVRALRQGVALDAVHADPFESEVPYHPRDKEKLNLIQADPELWEHMGRGKRLMPMLEEFYTHVYADPRLEPFFHRVTKQRAIEKQYEFLADIFTGTRTFFGHQPFNAHHWMVISDELFDYREKLFFDLVRKHDLVTEPMRARWAAIHEMYRREIVKSAPRGLYHGGVELMLEGFTSEQIEVDTVCDGCQEEITTGSTARMHRRTGELFCHRCEGQVMA